MVVVDSVEIIGRVKELISPFLNESGIELIDMIYRREQTGMTLRLLLDTAAGISIEECELANNALSGILDKEDFIGEHYVIEVSSPGLDRPIKTDRDFERAMGKELEVTTFGPIDGKRAHIGRIKSVSKEEIVLEAEGLDRVIPRAKIAMARLRINI